MAAATPPYRLDIILEVKDSLEFLKTVPQTICVTCKERIVFTLVSHKRGLSAIFDKETAFKVQGKCRCGVWSRNARLSYRALHHVFLLETVPILYDTYTVWFSHRET